MKNLICITCPRGCRLSIDENMNVSGNFCPRGKTYAINELTNPVRMLTTLVKTDHPLERVCPVRSERPIPKDKIFIALEELKDVKVKLPCKIGQIVKENIAGSGVNIIISKNIEM